MYGILHFTPIWWLSFISYQLDFQGCLTPLRYVLTKYYIAFVPATLIYGLIHNKNILIDVTLVIVPFLAGVKLVS